MSLLRHIVRETGMMPSEVLGLLPTIQRRYKVYNIKKKNGGMRSIAQPAREVKALQYAIMSGLLKELPVHPHATAYREGVSLVANAAPHVGLTAILKLDFSHFFHSITESDFISYLIENVPNLSGEDVELAGTICFWRPARRAQTILSVGAPSSPQISNALLFDLDESLLALATSIDANYTRYADDITISHPSASQLWELYPRVVDAISKNKRPRLKLNDQKTKLYSPKVHRGVTGLTLTNDGLVSLGRERKRKIQAATHHFLSGTLEAERLRELGGWLAFAKEVEPAFIQRLQHKYERPVFRLVCDAISDHDKATKAA